MKYFAYILVCINLYAGVRFLLNAVGILQTSKYSNTSNIVFGLLLSIAAGIALYLIIGRRSYSQALIVSVLPWGITIILLFFNMLFGDYK